MLFVQTTDRRQGMPSVIWRQIFRRLSVITAWAGALDINRGSRVLRFLLFTPRAKLLSLAAAITKNFDGSIAKLLSPGASTAVNLLIGDRCSLFGVQLK